jgi:hypothetical protein
MIKRFLPLILIIFFVSAPALGKESVVFRKEINDVQLTIKAPAAYYSGGKRIFIDKKKELGVELNYGELKVRANQANYDLKQDVIELAFGFKGSLWQYHIEGEYFRINPWTGNYAGDDLKFGYLVAYLYGKRFEFYGDKIAADKVSASPFYYPVFSSDSDKIEIYPGYTLAHQNTLRFFRVPFYYVPLYLNDRRRNYFDLPFPAFEVKKDIFHDTRGAVHTHYFINPGFYGDFSLHLSDKDGAGAQIQQIVRLSDHHQFELKFLGWQKSQPQADLAYAFQLFDNPRKSGQKLTFKEQQELEERIAGIEPKLTLGGDYSINEEIKRSVIDRYPDLTLIARTRGILYDHIYTIMPSISYGKIKEKKIFPEDAAAQEVDRNYERTKAGINFSYFLETPYMKPYISKAFWAVDYERSDYRPGGINRERISTSFTVRRPVFVPLGLFYEAALTKTLLDHGQSPFYFEEYGRLKDNGALDLYLQSEYLIAGNQLMYDFTVGQPYNEIYYLGVKAMDSYAVIKYDRRMQSWEFSFMTKEPAF